MKGVKIPRGVTCIVVILVIFGYMSWVMGLTNMLNTMMKTAHDLLLNTVFYLMGMCVLTGALGKILVEFGVVDLLQRLLRPVMKPLFNMPGVASLGAVLTFLSDNPAIIALSRDPNFARYFKRYQHVSLVNFGTAFGMGLLVIVFMLGQGYFIAPFIGLAGAICGCMVSTRLMQYFTCKDFPEYRTQDAVTPEMLKRLEQQKAEAEGNAEDDGAKHESQHKESTFVHILNSLLDGGKSGVDIGLAIIPGVLIISTFVMMLTFGGSTEGVDHASNNVVVYTGEAYQGTQLLPWLAGKISFIFEWLFGFTHPELVAFPITSLGAVGAALSLIPEFISQGIIDDNAIAVCTAMGMCWSGYLSTDAATLDSLGYRSLVPRAFFSTFMGGICGGIIAHLLYLAVTAAMTFFAASPLWTTQAHGYASTQHVEFKSALTAYDDSTYQVRDWYGVQGSDLNFSVNRSDSTITILNAYADYKKEYFFVTINKEATGDEPSYAAIYPVKEYSEFDGNKTDGYLYTYIFIYNVKKKCIDRGYYELVWGKGKRQTIEAQEYIDKMFSRTRKKGSTMLKK